MAEQASQQGQGPRGGARKGTRAPNWTTHELRLLFEACARNPQTALGLIGSDSRSRERRHTFFAEIATSVSALGVAIRDGMAAQRRFVEALKVPRDNARRLMRRGIPLSEAIADSLRAMPHMDLLAPMLRISIQSAPRGVDSLAAVAATMRQQQAPPSTSSTPDIAHDVQPRSGPPNPEHATGSQTSTGATLDVEEHSITAPGTGVHLQDDTMSEALDDLSLASSTEGGVGTGSASQALPPEQGAVEREEGDASPHGSAANAAHGDPQPSPATHAQDITMHDAPDHHADRRGDDDDDDDDVQMAPLRPHARGPRAASPLPTHVAGLWTQIHRAFRDSHLSFNENMQQLRDALMTESNALQSSLDSLTSHIEADGRQRNAILTQQHDDLTALLRQQNDLLHQQNDLLRQLVPARRGGAQGRGRARGRGQEGTVPAGRAGRPRSQEAPVHEVTRARVQGQEGTVPAGRAGRPRSQEAPVSVGEAAAGDAAVPEERGRPQTRARAEDRSLSSPPHPTKRRRRQ